MFSFMLVNRMKSDKAYCVRTSARRSSIRWISSSRGESVQNVAAARSAAARSAAARSAAARSAAARSEMMNPQPKMPLSPCASSFRMNAHSTATQLADEASALSLTIKKLKKMV